MLLVYNHFALTFHVQYVLGPIMQSIIGNCLVATTKPGPKPFEIRDSRLKGFLLRVQPTGRMSYVVDTVVASGSPWAA